MSLAQLAELLFAAQGVTARTDGYMLRSAPSAGALYPMEIYVFANNVSDIAPGIYHYNVREHALEQVAVGDFRKKISHAALYQGVLGRANVTFALAAVFDRTRSKYGERGYRYVYLEGGHISENIYLQAVSLGLGSVAVGAFRDGDVNELIGLDGQEESVVYLHGVGTL
jgi:SagB-type dehydrogenase family enzyme